MHSSPASHTTNVTSAARAWIPDDEPNVLRAAQKIDRPKAQVAQEDARIAGVANESAQQESRFAALQKDGADSLQKLVADSSYVDPNEAERAAEIAALQPAMVKTSALLSALKTARAASPAVRELAEAQEEYASACRSARAEREAMHRERVTKRLADSLLLSYSEMRREGFIARPRQNDPAGAIAALLVYATGNQKLLNAVIGRLSNFDGEGSSS